MSCLPCSGSSGKEAKSLEALSPSPRPAAKSAPDGDQRLLVYEYMSLGSLENHLYDLRKDTSRVGEFEQDRTEGSGSSSSSGRNDGLDIPQLLAVPNGKTYSEVDSTQKSTVKSVVRGK
nr:unnamed protein product [Digitaria exilis]